MMYNGHNRSQNVTIFSKNKDTQYYAYVSEFVHMIL